MMIQTCRGKYTKHMDKYEMLNRLAELYPQVAEIIRQVKESRNVDKFDKGMIEDQLISMCCTLNEAKEYNIVLGRWRNGKDDPTYSLQRKRVAEEEKTIRNETVFTIVSYGRKKNWTAFVDLPINVTI